MDSSGVSKLRSSAAFASAIAGGEPADRRRAQAIASSTNPLRRCQTVGEADRQRLVRRHRCGR